MAAERSGEKKRWKVRTILGKGNRTRGGESSKGRERGKKGWMDKKDSSSVRDRQREEAGWQRDREVDVSGHFL